jgi:hypothetical protein
MLGIPIIALGWVTANILELGLVRTNSRGYIRLPPVAKNNVAPT